MLGGFTKVRLSTLFKLPMNSFLAKINKWGLGVEAGLGKNRWVMTNEMNVFDLTMSTSVATTGRNHCQCHYWLLDMNIGHWTQTGPKAWQDNDEIIWSCSSKAWICSSAIGQLRCNSRCDWLHMFKRTHGPQVLNPPPEREHLKTDCLAGGPCVWRNCGFYLVYLKRTNISVFHRINSGIFVDLS